MQDAKNRHFGTIGQIYRTVSSQLRHASTIGKKNLLNTDTSSTCPHNMVNFSLLTAEICWQVWGTPANFNGFRVLAALLHGTLVVGVSQTAALNRGRHLCLAGRPSHSSWGYKMPLYPGLGTYAAAYVRSVIRTVSATTVRQMVVSQNDVGEERDLRELFRRSSGEDMEVDPYELRAILDSNFKQGDRQLIV